MSAKATDLSAGAARGGGRELALGVRYLAEFLLCGGSIDARFSGLNAAAKGARIHRQLQRQAGAGYTPEVALELRVERDGFCYRLNGRADGVAEGDDGIFVDEIKTTSAPLAGISESDSPAHWAQGMCYAHMLCAKRGLAACGVRLTYAHRETGEVKRFYRAFTARELEEYVAELLARYRRWALLAAEWQERRNADLKRMAFPFGGYREGQRGMAAACYQTFRRGGRLFCCAPTGIGKTMSALFPAMKAVGEGYGERIFYLTAKTVARRAAEEALARLSAGGDIHFRSITLTAKDKVCFLPERSCLPEACPYAEGYYDRLRDAMYEILQGGETLGRERLEAAGRQYRLCPYELSLDLSDWCDAVLCDYNYLFDPVVHLQRFFEGRGGEHLFLVDEAHNLVERGRDMYSAELYGGDFAALKKLLPPSAVRLARAAGGVRRAFAALRKRCEEQNAEVISQREPPRELAAHLARFTAAAEAFLESERGGAAERELPALYFDVLFYARIAEGCGGGYISLITRRGREVSVRLCCLDAAGFLRGSMDTGRAAVLFSATLQPLPYYRETLGGDESDRLLRLGSPFPQANMGLFVAGVSTRYADRPRSLAPVARLLAGMVGGRAGHYIAYFPSHAYMRQVLEVFRGMYPDTDTIVQRRQMDDAERDAFLAALCDGTGKTVLGFCVLGGIFAEGVDLPGDRLIGAAVVGVGLPQIGPVPDALRDYYDGRNGGGFEYAYQFPGMNKVLQAAGRVIRTESDRGVVLLVDSRFATPRYTRMFPEFWSHWRRVSGDTLPAALSEFWAGAGIDAGSAL